MKYENRLKYVESIKTYRLTCHLGPNSQNTTKKQVPPDSDTQNYIKHTCQNTF